MSEEKKEPKVDDQTQTMEAAKLGKLGQNDPTRNTPHPGPVEEAASHKTTTSPDSTEQPPKQ